MDLLCCHDLRDMSLCCRSWHAACDHLFLDCSLGADSLLCSASRGWFGRLTLRLDSHSRTTPPRVHTLSRLCSSQSPSTDHVRCLQLLLSRDLVTEDAFCGDPLSHLECLRALEVARGFRSLFSVCRGGLGGVPEVETLLLGSLRRAQCQFEPSDMGEAASSGSMACVKFLKLKVKRLPCNICYLAAQGGNVEILKTFEEVQGVVVSSQAVRPVVMRGHTQVLKHLLEQDPLRHWRFCAEAARGGHLECLELLHSNGYPLGEDCVVASLEGGHSDCLEYCLAHQEVIPTLHESWQTWQAVLNGNADCIRVLVDRGLVKSVTIGDLAPVAGSGKLELLRELCGLCSCAQDPRAVEVCRAAAAAGHVRCLGYLHESGWPWDSSAVLAAAERGQTVCLRYAHERGCAWDVKAVLECARRGGNPVCVRYVMASWAKADDPTLRDPWQWGWPVDALELFGSRGGLGDVLCAHDLCAMRLACRSWNTLCSSFDTDCSLSSPLKCAACKGWIGRLTSLLPSDGGHLNLCLSCLCHSLPATCCDEGHLQCVELLLSHGCVSNRTASCASCNQRDLSPHPKCMCALALHNRWDYPALMASCLGGRARAPEVESMLLDSLRRVAKSRKLTSWDMNDIAATGSMACVRFLGDIKGVRCHPASIGGRAVQGGNVEILKAFQRVAGLEASSGVIEEAAKRGHVQMLQYLIQQGARLTTHIADAAAHAGQLVCLKLLHGAGCPLGDQCVYNSLDCGDPACLTFCLDNGATAPHWGQAWNYALQAPGNGACLLILHDRGHSEMITMPDILLATNAGRLGLLRVLCDLSEGQNYLRTVEPCKAAATSGHVGCLKYLHESGWPCDATVTRAAAKHGHLACLRYLHDHGCPWTPSTLSEAKREGHASCVEYLLSSFPR